MPQKYNYTIDISKFILSLLVIAIHVNPFGKGPEKNLIFPLARIAVPMFFIVSGYFLFSKLRREKDHRSVIKRFCSRNIKLYFTWFILLFPITMQIRGYSQMEVSQAVKKIIKQFLFGSTFRASWYLSALVIGSLLIWILSKWLNNKQILLLGICAYILCCLTSNYFGFFEKGSVVYTIRKLYPGTIYNSFPASIVWIAMGKIFAEQETHRKSRVPWLIICLLLLFAEKGLLDQLVEVKKNDCYFMLLPVCWLLFEAILNIQLPKMRFAADIKAFSTISYCMHASLGVVLNVILKNYVIDTSGLPGSLLLYGITVASIMAFTEIVLFLEKRGWKWLRLLH